MISMSNTSLGYISFDKSSLIRAPPETPYAKPPLDENNLKKIKAEFLKNGYELVSCRDNEEFNPLYPQFENIVRGVEIKDLERKGIVNLDKIQDYFKIDQIELY